MSEKPHRLEWRAGHPSFCCGPFHAHQGTVTHLVPRRTANICDAYSEPPSSFRNGKTVFQRGRVFCLRTHSFGMLRREQSENVAASAPSSAPQHTSSLADTHLSNPQERPQHGRFFSCSYFSCPEERTHVRASVAEQ